MKTLDDAIDVAMGENTDADRRRIDANFARYESLVAEAATNPKVMTMIGDMLNMSRSDNLSAAIFTAFTIGLATGIDAEMPEFESERES